MAMSKTAVAALLLLVSGARAERHSLSLDTLELEEAESRGPDEDCAKLVKDSHATKQAKVFLVEAFGWKAKECACDGDMTLGKPNGETVILKSDRTFEPSQVRLGPYLCMTEEERPFRVAKAKMEDAEKWREGSHRVISHCRGLSLVAEALRYAAGAFKVETLESKGDDDLKDFDCGARKNKMESLTEACQNAVDAIKNGVVQATMHDDVSTHGASGSTDPDEPQTALRAILGLEAIVGVQGIKASEVQGAVAQLVEMTRALDISGGHYAVEARNQLAKLVKRLNFPVEIRIEELHVTFKSKGATPN